MHNSRQPQAVTSTWRSCGSLLFALIPEERLILNFYRIIIIIIIVAAQLHPCQPLFHCPALIIAVPQAKAIAMHYQALADEEMKLIIFKNFQVDFIFFFIVPHNLLLLLPLLPHLFTNCNEIGQKRKIGEGGMRLRPCWSAVPDPSKPLGTTHVPYTMFHIVPYVELPSAGRTF